jgi:hypothetical protein
MENTNSSEQIIRKTKTPPSVCCYGLFNICRKYFDFFSIDAKLESANYLAQINRPISTDLLFYLISIAIQVLSKN